MNSIARLYAQILGGALVLVGVLGWIPVVTPDGALFGLFGVNPVHNLVHLLTGLVGLGAGLLLPDRSVRLYTVTMTVVYGLVALIGYVQASALSVMALTLPDTLLHTAVFLLSLLVVLSAWSEYTSLLRSAQLFTSLRSQSRQPPRRANTMAPDTWQGTRVGAASPVAPFPASQQQATDTLTSVQEHVRWLEQELRKMDKIGERQQVMEQEIAQLHREVDQLRGYLQAFGRGQSPSGSTLPPQSWPNPSFTWRDDDASRQRPNW